MSHVYIVPITLAILAALPVWAQEGPVEQASACIAEPIFHCVQHLEDGGAIGHFGYKLRCPDDAGPDADLYIDAGDDNLFSPGPIARGQPKIFLPGDHFDEWEVDYTAAEVKAGSGIHWTVLDKTATVDFSKMKDTVLDCSALK